MSKAEKIDYSSSYLSPYLDLPKKSPDVSKNSERETAFISGLLNRLRKNSELYSLVDHIGSSEVAYGLITIASIDRNYQEVRDYDRQKLKRDAFIDNEWESLRFKALMAIARIINTKEGARLLEKVAKIGTTGNGHVRGFDEHAYSFSGNDENIFTHIKLIKKVDLFGGKYEQSLYSNWRPWNNEWLGVQFQPVGGTSLVKIVEDRYIAPVSTEKLQLRAVSGLGEMHMENDSWGILHNIAANRSRFVTDYVYPLSNRSQHVQELATDILVESGMGNRKILEDLRRQ